jgi:hypothetical protein
MAKIRLKLSPRHQRWGTRYNTNACTVSRALRETYGGSWKVGYGTARKGGFFSATVLRMGLDAQEAAWTHDEGRRVGSRTVTLYGNPGPTLEEQAAARKKAAAERKAAARKRAAARDAPVGRPAPAARPGIWAMLWNPPAAARQAAPQVQAAPRTGMYRTPAAAERARKAAASLAASPAGRKGR